MKRAVVFVLLFAGSARADTPAKCGAYVRLDRVEAGDVGGKVDRIDGKTVHVGKLAFDYDSDLPAPFAAGDTIAVHYRCGGPPPGLACDARIEDAHGKVLAIAAWNGTDDLSDGWTSKPGKIVTSEQSPNEKRTSVRRVHELELARGKASVTARDGACASVVVDGVTWLATGYAVTWDGVRPPEGIDRKGYSLVRK